MSLLDKLISGNRLENKGISKRSKRKLLGIKTPLMKLQKMIGMPDVKDQIASQVMYFLQGFYTNDDYLHTVIYGPPGTGKTTLAELIGEIYVALGVLSPNAPFTKIHRDDLIGGYLGETAIKTRRMLSKHKHGVLFLDEAYSISGNNDQYGKECLDTITAFLSENKSNMCMIAAGYEEDMKKSFFGGNEGLKRRFQWVVRLSPYSKKELSQILIKMAKDGGWDIAPEDALVTVNSASITQNAGDMEKLLTFSKIEHAKRCFHSETCEKWVLSKADLSAGVKQINSQVLAPSGPPEHMYM